MQQYFWQCTKNDSGFESYLAGAVFSPGPCSRGCKCVRMSQTLTATYSNGRQTKSLFIWKGRSRSNPIEIWLKRLTLANNSSVPTPPARRRDSNTMPPLSFPDYKRRVQRESCILISALGRLQFSWSTEERTLAELLTAIEEVCKKSKGLCWYHGTDLSSGTVFPYLFYNANIFGRVEDGYIPPPRKTTRYFTGICFNIRQ